MCMYKHMQGHLDVQLLEVGTYEKLENEGVKLAWDLSVEKGREENS